MDCNLSENANSDASDYILLSIDELLEKYGNIDMTDNSNGIKENIKNTTKSTTKVGTFVTINNVTEPNTISKSIVDNRNVNEHCKEVKNITCHKKNIHNKPAINSLQIGSGNFGIDFEPRKGMEGIADQLKNEWRKDF